MACKIHVDTNYWTDHDRAYPVHGAYAYPMVPAGYGSSGYGSYNPYGTIGSRAQYDPYRR